MQKQERTTKKLEIKQYEHKIAKKPLINPNAEIERQIIVTPEIGRHIEQAEKKVSIVPPTLDKPKIKTEKANLPIFQYKEGIEPIPDQKLELIAIEIRIKKEVENHLEGSMEEIVSTPQKIKYLSNNIKKPEELTVKTDFDLSIHQIKPEERYLKIPEIGLLHFISSVPKTNFDASLPQIISSIRPAPAVPRFLTTKPPEIITKNYFDKNISLQVISIKKEISAETKEKIGTEGITESEKSSDTFGDIQIDEEKWITIDSTGLPSDAQLFYIHGKEGAGFEVFRGFLMLEIMDRGRRPNLQLIPLPRKGKLEDISDPHDYYRLIWLKDCQIQDMRTTEIADEISKALNKGFLKYIVFANQEETVTTNIEEIKKTFMKHGRFSIIRLERDHVTDEELLEMGAVFAKILQINKTNNDIKEIFDNLSIILTDKIDSLWELMLDKKNSALEVLRDKYENNPKIRQFLPPSSKLGNESDEHFVMKQLAVKEILERGKGNWKVEEIDGRDYQTDWSVYEDFSQKISIESLKFRDGENGKKIPVKRPDITVRTEKGNNIWIEVETCKNLDDPLMGVKDKLRHLTEVEESERPDEIWVVFPYRKYFLYGATQFKEKISSYFNQFGRNNNTHKFKPRIFFADLYDEKLMELEGDFVESSGSYLDKEGLIHK